MRRLIIGLLLSMLVLVVLGGMILYSSTTNQASAGRVLLHLCWITVGVVACGAVSVLDYAWLRKWHVSNWLMGASLLLLIAVLVPGIGQVRNGASRWLVFGQPSELAKLAVILFLADYGAAHQNRMRERNVGFLIPGGIVGLLGALIFIEPDWGTATLVGAVALMMLVVGGAHWGYVVSASIIGVEVLLLLLLRNPLRFERVLAFLDPEKYRDGIGWQAWQAMLALGRGGWLGSSLGEGSHKNGFVPEQQTDFVLSLIGEELGLVGTVLVLLLFVSIILCGARLVWRIADPFGQLLASGVTYLIGLQAVINIGVVTSSLPNKGLALPFVSYGGSSMVCMLVCVGLLVSIARYGPVAPKAVAAARGSPHGTVKVAGPVGSLLYPSRLRRPVTFWKRPFQWMRVLRAARFPVVPLHPYQKPPIERSPL